MSGKITSTTVHSALPPPERSSRRKMSMNADTNIQMSRTQKYRTNIDHMKSPNDQSIDLSPFERVAHESAIWQNDTRPLERSRRMGRPSSPDPRLRARC